jgi:hypothetical protein
MHAPIVTPHLVTLPFSPSLPSSRPSFGEIRFRGAGSALPGGRSNLLRIVFEDEDVKKSAQRIETLWLQASGRSCVAKINAARPHHDLPDYRTNRNQINYTPRPLQAVCRDSTTGPGHARGLLIHTVQRTQARSVLSWDQP